jgi:glycosyltransferase involved in cell wall biosynthesis
MSTISIIIPCYFNEHNVPETVKELLANESNFTPETSFQYVMVDDGSKDGTWKELLKFKEVYPDKVTLVKLSGNFGSYNAILAGMQHAKGDCNVIIACDLQDPVELMPKMMAYWMNGTKLVVANRRDRDDPWVSKSLAVFFQFMMRKFALPNLPAGGFDYVLFDKQLKDEVLRMDEKNSNSLYLLVWMKYDYITIPYERRKRKIGKSRWTLSKKLKLFIDSFVAFSYVPIRIITVLGFLLGIAALLYAVFILYMKMTGKIAIEGWSAMMLVFLVVSSFQMIGLGILGEYLWRALDASRKRPNYIIESVR